MMSCDSGKWECHFCTFRNWPSAVKCTMCRGPKPFKVIEEGAPPVKSPTVSVNTTEEMSFSEICPMLTSPQSQRHRSFIVISPGLFDTRDNSVVTPCDAEKKRAPESNSSFSDTEMSFLPSSSLNQESSTSVVLDKNISSSVLENAEESVLSNENENIKLINNSAKESGMESTNDLSVTKNDKATSLAEVKLIKISDYADANPSLPSTDCSFSPTKESMNWSTIPSPQMELAAAKNNTMVVDKSHEQASPGGAERFSPVMSPSRYNNKNEKWTCFSCTYDNWPRAVKCVMCACPRGERESLFETDVGTKDSYPAINIHRNNIDSVLVPAIGNMALGLGNNRSGSLIENPSYAAVENSVNESYEMRRRMFRSRDAMDTRWLEACRAVVDGNIGPVEDYLTAGGDPARQLSQTEVVLLDRPSAFGTGFTLIHLALRFHQENVLATLLSHVDRGPSAVKRVPSYSAPGLAADISRLVLSSIRQRKGNFRCYFTSEIAVFTLPSEIEDLPTESQETLFGEILDRDVQKELEDGQIINWSVDVTEQLNSRLYALWNRSAGDCLLDSVLQATWGIFDRENGLRRALSDSLHDCATLFYQRWKESELFLARMLDFSLNEAQCNTEWAKLLSLASQPGSSLEQLHIFALAHVLRRPIIVYGVKYVKSFRGETLGYARYEGIYLPLLWETSFCWKWPIALGYTRGHFSALVTAEPDCDPLSRVASATQVDADGINGRSTYLPLISVDGAPLPIHFLTQTEMGKEEMIIRQWMDVCYTDAGIMLARQRIQKRPLLVSQMVEEWLNHYRRLGQMASTPYLRQTTENCFSSDGESDND